MNDNVDVDNVVADEARVAWVSVNAAHAEINAYYDKNISTPLQCDIDFIQ